MRKLHLFVPISASDAFREETVTLDGNDLTQESTAGFVMFLCDGKW